MYMDELHFRDYNKPYVSLCYADNHISMHQKFCLASILLAINNLIKLKNILTGFVWSVNVGKRVIGHAVRERLVNGLD